MDAKEYHKNPRRISNKQMRELQQNLQDLGDLSGIILDLNSMELIGGNQRSKVMNLAHCEIEYIEQNETPDAQGTVALGFVLWKGKKYNYREVRWSPEQCEKANITANKLGGTWDFDILKEDFERDQLLTFGFEEWELPQETKAEESKGSDKVYDKNDFLNGDEEEAPAGELCKCPKCGFEWQK